MFSWLQDIRRKGLFSGQDNKKRQEAAKLLYQAIERQSRLPVFYSVLSVPDTFTGRFEMIALNAGLVIDRLQNEQGDHHDDAVELAQALFDEMFSTMDLSIRELGVGDLGVPKHMKRMMIALKGRALSYVAGYHHSHEALRDVIRRNLFATVPAVPDTSVEAVQAYITVMMQNLRYQEWALLATGTIFFPEIQIEKKDAA